MFIRSTVKGFALLGLTCLLCSCEGDESNISNDGLANSGLSETLGDQSAGIDSGENPGFSGERTPVASNDSEPVRSDEAGSVEDPDGASDSEADPVATPDPGTDVTLEMAIPHQVARVGEEFSLAIPAGTFSDQEIDLYAQVLRLDMSGEVPEVLNDFWWQRDLDHHWLSFDGAEFSGTPESYEDAQTLQIEVRATARNGSEAATSFLLVVVDGEGELRAPASTESECAHVLGQGDTGWVDADALGIEPGDSICLRGGETTGALNFRNLEGRAGQPIYIINVDGAA